MKCRTTLLICLLIVAWCGRTNAELDTLGKLRSSDRDVCFGDGGYDLALMGDDAAPFLVQLLTDENLTARKHAAIFLDRFYADSRILPALTELFQNSTDIDVRANTVAIISSIDAEYARKLMAQYLNVNDVKMQDLAVSVLSSLGDANVIPKLIQKLENPNTDLITRRDTANRLAYFKHNSAKPVLLDILDDPRKYFWSKEETLVSLAQIADEQSTSILVDYLDNANVLSRRIISALSQSNPSIVQPLLKRLEQLDTTKSPFMRNAIIEILGSQKDPVFSPIYEKVYLETDDPKLQSAIVRALGNMGEEGFEFLLKIVQKKPTSNALRTLATYNSTAAIDAVALLTYDKTSPIRLDAIQALVRYSNLWKDEVSKHITKLLPNVNSKEKLVIIEALPHLGDSWKEDISKHLTLLLADIDLEVRLLTIDLIRRMNLTVMAPALKKLTQEAKGRTQNAAQIVLDILTGKSQLELKVKMSRPRYDYEQPITLTYRLTNVSNHPIKIAFYKIPTIGLKLDIQQPDGTAARYIGPRMALRALTLNDFQTLQPGNEITGTIPISQFYRLNQEGVYTVQLHVVPGLKGIMSDPKVSRPSNKKIPLSKKIKSNFLAWSDTLISPKVQFNIEPPPVDKLNKMIASIDPEFIVEANAKEIAKTCYKLSVLQNPKATVALKKLALIDVTSPDDFRHELKLTAGRLLMQYPDSELVPTWIEILNREKISPVSDYSDLLKLLGESGNTYAIEPLQQIAFRQGNYGLPVKASLAMQQLGDNRGVEWFRKVAFRKLRHWKKDERQKGVHILNNLYPRKERITTRLHNLRDPQFYADNYKLFLNWAAIREKAGTVSGLKELLKHENPIIQRSAAYELAYLGDKTGIHLIQQDLYANESATRWHARNILSKLQSK